MEHSEKLLRLVDKLSGTFRETIEVSGQTEWKKFRAALRLRDKLSGTFRETIEVSGQTEWNI